MTVNLFVLSTGFQYYFSTLLIEHLGLTDVAYAMYQPREGIERRAGAAYRVVSADAADPLTRLLGKKVGKWRFAHHAFEALGLAGKEVRVYSPYYNESFVYALRRLLEKRCARVEYNMIPDGAALLRHLPGKAKGAALPAWLTRLVLGVEPADVRHKSGSWSPFLTRVYHFAAKEIHADPAKVVIVPLKPSAREPSDDILVLGGLGGVSREFVLAAREKSRGHPVRFRLHPKNRSGAEYIAAEAPDWQELEITGILEEHLLAQPYCRVIGYYSSAVMFNHLFVSSSRSEFIVDAAREDPDYHATAEACGIPVTVV